MSSLALAALLLVSGPFAIAETASPSSPEAGQVPDDWTIAQCDSLFEAGKYRQALTVGNRILEQRRQEPGQGNLLLAEALHLLARINFGLDYDELAKALLTEALPHFAAGQDEGGLAYADALDDLGRVCLSVDDLERADELLNQALALRREELGDDHLAVAESLRHLAQLRSDQGRPDDAVDLFQQALDLHDLLLPAASLETGYVLWEQGEFYLDREEYEKARAPLESALQILQDQLPQGHPRTASCLHGVGLVHHMQGESEKGLAEVESALAVYEETFGLESFRVANALNSLALIHIGLGELEAAEDCLRRSLTIFQKILPPNDPNITIARINLAYLLAQDPSTAREAELVFDEAVRDLESRSPTDFDSLAKILINRASLHGRAGDYDRAIEDLGRAVDLFEQTRGPDHPSLALQLEGLALYNYRNGDTNSAIRYLERALRIQEKASGPQDESLVTFLKNLGYLYSSVGDRKKAEECEQRATTITEARALSDPEHFDMLEAIAISALRKGDVEEAISLLRQQLAIVDTDLGPDHPRNWRIRNLISSLEDMSPAQLDSLRTELARSADDQNDEAKKILAFEPGEERGPGEPVADPGVEKVGREALTRSLDRDPANDEGWSDVIFVGPNLWARLKEDPLLADSGHGAMGHADGEVYEQRFLLDNDRQVFFDSWRFRSLLRWVTTNPPRAATSRERELYYAHISHEIIGKPVTVFENHQDRLAVEVLDGKVTALELLEEGDYVDTRNMPPERVAVLENVRLRMQDYAAAMRDGRYRKAEEELEGAIAELEQAVGSGHDVVVSLILKLGDLRIKYQHDLEKGLSTYQRASRACEDNQPKQLEIVFREGLLLDRLGKTEEARSRLARACELAVEVLGEGHPETVVFLRSFAQSHALKNDHSAAVEMLRRCLEIQAAWFGKKSLEHAEAAKDLAEKLRVVGDYETAQGLLEGALGTRLELLDLDSLETAHTWNTLGAVLFSQGDYEEARKNLETAREITARYLPDSGMDLANILNSIATIHLILGEFAEADALFDSSLKMAEEAGVESVALLNNAGDLYRLTGKLEKSMRTLAHAYQLESARPVPDIQDLATILGNAAKTAASMGDLQQQEALLLQGKTLIEDFGLEDSPIYPRILNDLGTVCVDSGREDQGLQLLQDALVRLEELVGPDHFDVGTTLFNIARARARKGETDAALQVVARSMAVHEKSLGPYHHRIADSGLFAARVLAMAGRPAEGLDYLERVLVILEKNLDQVYALGAEQDKTRFLDTMGELLGQSQSYHLSYLPGDPRGARLSLRAALLWKGCLLDVMSLQNRQVRDRMDEQDADLLTRLTRVRAQIARVSLNAGGQEDSGITLQRLQQKLRDMESRLGKPSLGREIPSEGLDLDALIQAVPDSCALIEYIPYIPLGDSSDRSQGKARFAAYVITGDHELHWVDLADAEEITNLAGQVRRTLSSPIMAYQEPCHALYARILRPLEGILSRSRILFLSPEGQLNLVPFAALLDDSDRFLIERFEIGYVSSGKFFLHQAAPAVPRSGVVIFASPEYDRSGSQVARAAGTLRSRDMEGVRFSPLPGTSVEASALAAVFPEAQVYLADRATEENIKSLMGPRILHIATHGFFLENLDGSGSEQDRMGNDGMDPGGPVSPQATMAENPLLRSGLAFSGANNRRSGSEDGILTALEASGLDLAGTRLVTLSACETGVGELRIAQGVYGLRRAFLQAGAESVLSSLWKISDKETQELMTSYYRLLQEGQGRTQALRNVQVGLLQQQQPYYWAPFILTGDWRPLENQKAMESKR